MESPIIYTSHHQLIELVGLIGIADSFTPAITNSLDSLDSLDSLESPTYSHQPSPTVRPHTMERVTSPKLFWVGQAKERNDADSITTVGRLKKG
jgi:hypothetical protein